MAEAQLLCARRKLAWREIMRRPGVNVASPAPSQCWDYHMNPPRIESSLERLWPSMKHIVSEWSRLNSRPWNDVVWFQLPRQRQTDHRWDQKCQGTV